MNIVLITGASSGMGLETAVQVDTIYDDLIDEIWLVARRAERLEKLSEVLYHKCRIIPADLTNETDVQELDLLLNLLNPTVKLLVNAAGYGIVGDFVNGEVKDQTGMVKLNCEALVRVTHIVLPYMKNGGRIIQFASSAAFVPQIDFSVYAASKSFVLSFSESLNYELKSRNISVTAVCPGPVNTEFFDVSEKNGTNFSFKKYFMADAKDVVALALFDSYKRKSISIYSYPMKMFCILSKITPHDLMLKIMTLLKKDNE